MSDTGTRGPIAAEDFLFHDPATGFAAQSFDRATSTGGVNPKTRLSAQDVPLRDAPTVTGARTPSEKLADTAAAKNVQTVIDDTRKNTPWAKNFDTYGGTPGAAASLATASKNTEVLQRIVSDMQSDGNVVPIFFPGQIYMFAEFNAAMPTFTQVFNLTLIGTGFGTVLLRHGSASANLHLLNFIDCKGARLIDIMVDHNGNSGSGLCANFSAVAEQEIGDVYIVGTRFSGGAGHLQMIVSGTVGITNYWISGCNFLDSAGANIAITGGIGGHIINNTLSGGQGIYNFSTGGNVRLKDLHIAGNVSTSPLGTIFVSRSGAYDATRHTNITIERNTVANGDISVAGVDLVDISTNKLAAGRVVINYDMAQAFDLRCVGNYLVGSTSVGLEVIGASTNLKGFEISGGQIRNALTNGIRMNFASATARSGRIRGVSIFDCSRADSSGTDYAGILLDAPNGAGGVQDTIVDGNVIRCESTTTNFGNKHLYGVEERGGGASARNMIGPNFIKGYVTADVSAVSASSLDVVAAVAAFAPFDGGNGI